MKLSLEECHIRSFCEVMAYILYFSRYKSEIVNKTYNAADLDAFMKIAASWQNNTKNIKELQILTDMQNYLNPAMNMYKKRERTQNWNHQEKKFLLELCKKDMRIIENKRLDAGLTAVKNKAWKIIHQKFSAEFGTDRTCNRLKEQWRRMKACTRNEILDYNNRVQRYGQEAADRKKPSPFTFEIWEFMQEAKRQCKSEALDGVDYSKMPLKLEEDFEFNEALADKDDNDSEEQKINEIHIKEENGDAEDSDCENDGSGGSRHSIGRPGSVDRMSSTPPNNLDESTNGINSGDLTNNQAMNSFQQENSLSNSFNISNIASTLEALNALRNNLSINPLNNGNVNHSNGSGGGSISGGNGGNNSGNSILNGSISHDGQPQSKRQRRQSNFIDESPQNGTLITNGNINNSIGTQSTEMKIFMEMQAKEHLLRMQILETQLQAAKYSRDIVEINKSIALQKLHDIANRRMS
ncbi:putative mediator of RNA polymerase II transcription subunit 26 [Condylostylus longicornis]|uniref:putative mediator of RNA polymerase II transcription subunit 26 n=1 Tax=Condylostylus longicornis TaxID=2530218 RepID=UPI00244DF63D|nr:putative mediator of RNA polymerase II transcription subunit 26 [Condylostylus longicornis]